MIGVVGDDPGLGYGGSRVMISLSAEGKSWTLYVRPRAWRADLSGRTNSRVYVTVGEGGVTYDIKAV